MTTRRQDAPTTPEVGGMGHSVKRKEDPRFIRGAGEYIDDVNLPGQLWLDIVRSPYAHATIKGIDSSEALKVPGVAAVVTGKDLGGLQAPLDADPRRRHADGPAGRHGHVPGPGGRRGHRDEPLRGRRRRGRGPGRLRAAAGHRRPAQGARGRTRSSSGPTVARTSRTTTSGTGSRATRAPTDAALAASEVRISEDIYIPRIHVASIETCGCVADWDPVRQQLTLHMTSQAPHAIRTVVALVAAGAGLPISEQNIRVKTHDIGGGFGGKVPVYPGYVLAVAASFLIGKPVKWIEDRSENLQADSFARDYHIHAEMGADEGRQDPGPQGQDDRRPRLHRRRRRSVEVPGRPVQRDHRLVRLRQRVRRGRRRLHEQAARRRRLPLLVPGDRGRPRDRADGRHPRPRHRQGSRPSSGWRTSSSPSSSRTRRRPAGSTTRATTRAALQLALDMIGYDDLRREQAEKRARGELMGIGISSFTEIVGAGPSHDFDILGLKMFDSCEIRVHPTGKVLARIGVQTQGQGHETTFAQIIAEELGLPGRRHQDRVRRHRHRALRARHVRLAVDAGRRRGHRHRLAEDPEKAQQARRPSPRGVRGRPRVDERQVLRQGLAGPVQDDPGDRVRGLHEPSRRDGGRPRGGRLLRPAEPDVPVRSATSASSTSTRAPARSTSAASSRSTTAATSSTR